MNGMMPTLIAQLQRLLIATSIVAIFYPQTVRSGELETTEPQGEVLIYEVDPRFIQDGQKVDMERLVYVVNRRLNFGSKILARVRKLEDRRIEIALLRSSDKDKRQVEKILASTGSLEFRILANNRNNKELIERALADPSKSRLLNDKGTLLAWWVPVKAGEEPALTHTPGIVLRKKLRGGRQITEAFVVNDKYNVTGAYIRQAKASTDVRGLPCINITFNKEGGLRLGGLTRDHLPDIQTNFTYKLGIIFNDVISSAPVINSEIRERAEITGSFSKQDVDDLVRLLKTGSLPARIRPVEKKDSVQE